MFSKMPRLHTKEEVLENCEFRIHASFILFFSIPNDFLVGKKISEMVVGMKSGLPGLYHYISVPLF